MTPQDYLRVLRERWALVTTAVVVALALAGGIWFLRPPEYTAALRMYVSAQSTDTAQAAFQGAQLSQQRVTSYVELVGTPRVSEDVVRQLGLTARPDDVAKQVTATSKLDSVIIDVAVTGESPRDVTSIANAIGTIFPRLVDELERPSSPTGTPPVVVRVVQPAAIPTVPSSLGLPMALALGLLAGLTVGVGAALARHALDTSIKSPEQLRTVTDAPNLGSVAFDAAVAKRPLTVHEDPQSSRAETFRQMRTNLQFLDVDAVHKVVVVTSSMPSEGKTTTTANLAIALASAGARVLVIEADLRRPNLANLLGLEQSVGLTSVLAGRTHVEEVVQYWPGGGFDVLASGPLPPNPSELLGSQHMTTLLRDLRDHYEFILLDAPPLLPVTDAAALGRAIDGAILVCRFKRTTRDQVRTATAALHAASVPLLATVLSMVPSSGAHAYAKYNSYYYRHNQATPPQSPPSGSPLGAAARLSGHQPAPRPGPVRERR